MSVVRSLVLFMVAAVVEIGGAWLVWQGWREHRGLAWIAIQTLLLAGAVAIHWNGRSAFLLTPPYLGFQILPFFAFELLDRELRTSAQLRAMQDLVADGGRLTERLRIAGELHDVTAQNLFAITINLETLRQQTTDLAPSGMEILNECQNLCEQSLQEVRTLSYTLHPPALDRHGIMPSLHWYIQKFGERTGMEISLDASPDLGRLPLEMETDIFRIVQEGLSNIVRHSGPGCMAQQDRPTRKNTGQPLWSTPIFKQRRRPFHRTFITRRPWLPTLTCGSALR